MNELSLVQALSQYLNISRRQAAGLVQQNRVQINGRVCSSISAQVELAAAISLDGKKIQQEIIRRRVLLYYKPLGEISSQSTKLDINEKQDIKSVTRVWDKEVVRKNNHPSAFDKLPSPEAGKWIMVGRLDINTSGLLLFTTDGEMAYRLMHPKYKLDREYIVRVRGEITAKTLARLRKGIMLDGKISKFNDIVPMHANAKTQNQYFHLVVQEGRNRLVRRLWEVCGFQVSRLTRVRYANISLPQSLKPGQHMMLNKTDRRRLAACVDL